MGCFRVRWLRFTIKKRWAKHLLEAAKAVQLETDSSWQNESPYEGELELLRMGSDLRLEGSLMRQAFKAGKWGDRTHFPKHDKLSGWAGVKVRECYSEVEQIDEDRKSRAQLILQKRTDFLRRIIAPNDGVGGVTMSYVCLHCHRYPLGDYIW